MCGIAGIVAPSGRVDPSAIERMVASMHHRGPDDSGTSCRSGRGRDCWLGSTRLAIIDLSAAGHMPMDDGAGHHTVYNGEVYNFEELRRDLAARGQTFTSHTDTEVVLRLLASDGPEALSRLRGMFALAVWDESTQELLLVRDRAGKKPLYYARRGEVFAFASEVRAILESGLVERRLDVAGLETYLANGFTVAPSTLVAGIASLLPGEAMRVGADGTIVARWQYWSLPTPDPGAAPQLRLDDRREQIRETLAEATRLRLVSDVPLGLFLSGGMDSTILAALLHRAGTDVRTFSISFPGDELDESSHSRRVAATLGTAHTEVPITEDAFHAWLPDALRAMDQPTFDGINTYFVARAAREGGLTVALSGLGADEAFGGYPFFRTVPWMIRLAGAFGRFPSAAVHPVVRQLGRRGTMRLAGPWKLLDLASAAEHGSDPSAPVAAYQAAQSLFPSWGRDALLDPSVVNDTAWTVGRAGLPPDVAARLAAETASSDPVSATSILAWRLFLGERALRDTDQMSMAVSLEVRAPFVDHVLVEELYQLPGSVRAAGAPNKPFELSLVEDHLAGVWSARPKQGFSFPFPRWLSSPAGVAAVEPTMVDDALLRSIGLRPEAVRAVWAGHRAHPERIPWSRVWAIHVLAQWCETQKVTV